MSTDFNFSVNLPLVVRGAVSAKRIRFPSPFQSVRAVVGLEIECAHQNAIGVTGHVSQSRPTIPDGRISRVRF